LNDSKSSGNGSSSSSSLSVTTIITIITLISIIGGGGFLFSVWKCIVHHRHRKVQDKELNHFMCQRELKLNANSAFTKDYPR